ncbi:thymidylate synthase [uncultured Roseobacter sp.]|uniref:thymidylate synthase n=1 Tax=uncultured Roseobacter sp. TaxID=114847 RepID=UPI00263597AB|nr:thymidylate synthase [uncultured Roseobacter sp.]
MEDYFVVEGGSHNDADTMFRKVMSDILSSPVAKGVNTGSARIQQDTNEGLGYSIVLSNPLDRIISNDAYKLDLPVAVARFVWMISGNNRLADIKFYQKQVENFSDDGIIVPGSSYGARIRQAFPGIDQLQGVIDKLKADSNSRRAAISIYQPTDATRESKDVPCAFGMFFHIRDGALHTQVVMRSNNATVLLPFNIFEFSMLGEVIASECGVVLGPFKHYAASMHVYESAREWSQKIADDAGAKLSSQMQHMPASPLDEIRKLVQFEAEMRHRSEAISDATIADWIKQIQDEFSVYWQQFAYLLLVTPARRKCSDDGLEELRSAMDSELANIVDWRSQADEGTDEEAFSAASLLSVENENIVLFHQTRTSKSLQEHILKREQTTGDRLPTKVVFGLQEHFTEKLAAQRDDVDISSAEFEKAVSDTTEQS